MPSGVHSVVLTSSSSLCKYGPSSAKANMMPVLTAGGSSDAEMATPTSELVLLPRIERPTPTPDGSAIARPTKSPEAVPLWSEKVYKVELSDERERFHACIQFNRTS